MAMPVILKGDTSARISFLLTDDFSYEGYSLRVDFHHVSCVIYDLQAGSTVSVQYTAEDTSRFPLGTGLMTLTLENEVGVKRTLPVERVKVTDAPAEVYDGAIIIDPGMAKVEDLPERFTDNDVRSKINQILSFLRRCATFCLLGIMSYGFVAASVLTAPKGEIYNDSPVVTNVNLEGLAVKSEIPQVVTNVVRDVSDTLFNNYISATNDNFVAAVNASQVSVDDSVVAEIAEYAGVDVPTAGATSIGALLIVILGGLSALKHKKQDALSQEQVEAVNSGITADKVSKLEGIEAGAQVNPTPIAPVNATESGMFADAYWTKRDLAGKADRVANATSGNLAALDENGNLTDSGMALRDFAVAESLAPRFVSYNAYEVGDLCTSFDNDDNHRGTWLYKCILATDGSQWTPPEIDPTHWALATVEDVLAALRTALAADVAWLKKNKVQTLKLEDESIVKTAENGVAKLDDFFTESNSLLNGRLAYSRNATGLKDRAFNTLSFDGTEYNLSTALADVTPTASGQPRDLLIVATATAATTISFTAGTIKGDKPTIDGSGTWLITLTEYASGVWYCRQIKMEDAA